MNGAINAVLEEILGQIPKAKYFSLFMIYTKRLKEKRILFIVLMIVEYLLLKHFISFNIWFQISYTIITYIILKMLYKDKSQITDIFTFSIASIILILICGILYFPIWFTINNYILYAVLTRIFMFAFLILFNNKLNRIQKIYKLLWNRNDKIKKKIKSTTFRSLNIVIFNIMFYIINIGMIFTIFLNGGV